MGQLGNVLGAGIAENVGGKAEKLPRKGNGTETLGTLQNRKSVFAIFQVFDLNGIMGRPAVFDNVHLKTGAEGFDQAIANASDVEI